MPATRRSLGKPATRDAFDDNGSLERGGGNSGGQEEVSESSVSSPPAVSDGDRSASDNAVKTVLYFPVEGTPRLVDIPRVRLRGRQYRPYVDGYGLGDVCVTYMFTEPADHYLVAYLDQTLAFQTLRNSFVTHMLQVLVGPGKNRPWFGPLLVEYQREGALNIENMKEEVVCVVRHLHAIYERLHKDPQVVYDAVPIDSTVKAVSPAEFFFRYHGDVEALLE
ncbi:hypothetical protein VNI00_017209 [Paramarasmius palmivorus]|uniref:Uncharacterized protein n=1 Tax=Paramarasmius palmivorus TaxID=297713 RepID=A0AAW0B8Z8_9AGAR